METPITRLSIPYFAQPLPQTDFPIVISLQSDINYSLHVAEKCDTYNNE